MDSDQNNSRDSNSKSSNSRKCSAKTEFFMFLVTFGWEGPLALFLGFRDFDIAYIIAGAIITAFLWGIFGISITKEFIKEIK